MRVLLITNMFPRPEAPWYGVFVRDQAEALRAAGVEVDVHVIEGWKSPLEYLAAASRIASTLAGANYDLIHAHHGHAAWVAQRCRAAASRRIPLVVTLHDGDLFAPRGARVRWSHRLTRFWRLRAASKADLVITVHRDHCPPHARRVVCLPCGVDAERFKPMDRDEARRGVGGEFPPGRTRILFPADPFRPEKRFDLASLALERFRAGGGQGYFATGGDIAPQAMPLQYNAADVVLLTSDYEASPMVLKEAVACERPIVSRRVGDADYLLDGIEGAFLCGADPGEIAQALARAAQTSRAKGGRERLEQLGMTAPQVTRRLVELYRELAAK